MLKYAYVKRGLDLIFSVLGLFISSPLFLLVALAVNLESPGGAFFKQKRPGRNGHIFTVFKFRTMKVDSERNGIPLNDMERMTKVGAFLRKTSIDELPQLLNILRGEMSFIGPRPLLIQYLQYYSTEQMRRHEVTPGISGWAQVNGRNALTWDEKFKLDVWYVDHISFILDAKIFAKTIKSVISRNGINNSQEHTMVQFRGTSQS